MSDTKTRQRPAAVNLTQSAEQRIADLMAKAPEVQTEARAFLVYVCIAPVVGVAPFMLDGIFIGATRAGDMRNMMALSLAIYVAAALVLVPWLGNHGLWLALLISFVARGVTLWLRYPALEASLLPGTGGDVKI